MLLEIPGYTIFELVYTGKKTLIYRGRRNSDNASVILKITRDEPSPSSVITQLKHEFAIMQKIHSTKVPHAYGLENIDGHLILITEDAGGKSLDIVFKDKQFDLETFLIIACELAQGLGDIHHQQVIHKDIKPHNIIVNLESKQVEIIDFGIATLLSREIQYVTTPDLMEGTFAYISPEQTGRINRAIDYRTDIYSLGVTLYEMITKQLPFQSTHFMDLVHQHIAKQPIPPHTIDKEIPPPISDIIMKCLSKDAEDRYNSAYGLKNDLEECLGQLKSLKIIKPFEIGKNDVFDHFHIPQKLYSRKTEVQTLLSAFEYSVQGQALLLLVRGYAGIGKSSLVNEIQKPIAQKKGFFVSGKFEQFKKDIPYTALIQALTSLIQHILSESAHRLGYWKRKLAMTLGSNAQVIIDVIPELEQVIGKQEPVAPLGRQAEEQRFKNTLASFIRTFLDPEHPLVIFLDDLQWADSASLQWLQFFFTEIEQAYLLVIGAYRINEVDDVHPLSLALRAITQAGVHYETLDIKPLSIEAVEALIKDTLHDSHPEKNALAQLVFQKTQGNPFFIIQFLKMLYEKQLIYFEPSKQIWQGNLVQIEKLNVTDNVADFLSQKIHGFPESTQTLLKVAAAIGNTFDMHLLARVHEIPFAQMIADFWIVIQEELVISHQNFYSLERAMAMPLDPNIPVLATFQHDRIQQAAYQLIRPEEMNLLHYTIGQTLLRSLPIEKMEEKIIDIVNQLNKGIEIVKEENEKFNLAQLNLKAGQKALNAAAYPSAAFYLTTGVRCLPANSWKKHYALSCTLYENLALTEFQLGKIDEAEQLLDLLAENVKTDLEKGNVYYLHMRIYSNIADYVKCIAAGLRILNLFGEYFPSRNLKWWTWLEKFKLKFNLLFIGVENLSKLPKSNDEVDSLVERTYGLLHTVRIATDFAGVRLNMLKAFNRTLKYGLTDYSTYTISRYGIFLATEYVQKYSQAYQIGVAASEIAARFEVPVAINVKGFTEIWGKHFKSMIPELKELADRTFVSGNLELASQYLFFQILYMLMKGDYLDIVYDQLLINQKLIGQTKSLFQYYGLVVFGQVCMGLKGLKPDPTNLTIPKDPLLENYTPPQRDLYKDAWTVFLLYLHEKYEPIQEIAEQVQKYYLNFPGQGTWLIFYFYHALTLAATYPNETNKRAVWKQLRSYIKRIKRWSDACPENHLHQYWLLSAEIARCAGQTKKAEEYYELAIANAKKNEFHHEEALAYELAAKYYMAQNKKLIAAAYLSSAYQAYARWGAVSKLALLRKKYPELLNDVILPKLEVTSSDQTHSNAEQATRTSITAIQEFDIHSIISASQTLSKEIIFDKLLLKIINVLIVNAGADHAFLLLKSKEGLVVRAEIVSGQESGNLLEEPLEAKADQLSTAVVNYVERTEKELLLNNVLREGMFTHDPYIVKNLVKSILCIPLMHLGKLIGVFYLENRLSKDAFTPQKLEVLSFLTSQMAISIENAMFYAELESKVQERTQELQEAQHQLIQQEKFASLGLLTTGLAHEIKNPLNFVLNFSKFSTELTTELDELVLKRKSELQEDLFYEFKTSFDQLSKFANEIYTQGKRIDGIVSRMVQHSKGTAEIFAPANIHTLIESAINVAIKDSKAEHPDCEIIFEKHFDHSNEVLKISAQNINRVLQNLLNNACWAVYQKKIKVGDSYKPIISVKTRNLGRNFEINIFDNGIGIPPEAVDKVFTPFFTTRKTGEGVGLGLSLSHSIIVDEHQGTLTFKAKAGEFTEFIITLPVR